MWPVEVELVGHRDGMWDLMQYNGDSDYVLFAGVAWTGIQADHRDPQLFTVTGPHSVRVPSKTALASATCPLGTHSSDILHPWGIVVVPELERAPKMSHRREKSLLLLKKVLC